MASNITQGTVLWKDPHIVYTSQLESGNSFFAAAGPILKDKEIIILSLVAWSLESDQAVRSRVERARNYVTVHPKHTIWHLCNTAEEVSAMRAAGEQAELYNHNIFVDPSKYFHDNDATKLYNAVYNAQLKQWKRHNLAAGIRDVALIYHSFSEDQEMYRAQLSKEIVGCHFINHELAQPPSKSLDKATVNRVLNASRCGLCLSEIEGAMHSSVEYLLCGLPVVSTTNKGGRNFFLDPTYSKIVGPTTEEISNAVQALIDSQIDPKFIRNKTVEIQQREIKRFCEFVNTLKSGTSDAIDFATKWNDVFRDKLLGWETVDLFVNSLK